MVEESRAEVIEQEQASLSAMDDINGGLFNFGICPDDSSWIRRTKDLFQATLLMSKGLCSEIQSK